MLTKISSPLPLIESKMIGIFCPASAISLEPSRLEILKSRLENFRFSAFVHKTSFKSDPLGNAGTPLERATAFNDLIQNPQIGALISFWGGQDTIQILPHIDYELFGANPRWVCGYSDSGVLLQALSETTKTKTLYGLGGITLTKPNFHQISWDSYYNLASGKSDYIPKIVAGSPWHSPSKDSSNIELTSSPIVLRKGSCEGRSLVCSVAALCVLLGTPFEPCFDDRVLFLELSEDYDAKTLCRFLAQLDLSGVFSRVAGVVFAKFTSDSKITEQIFRYLIETHIKKDIPIMIGMDFGHTDPIITLPNLAAVCLDTTLPAPIVFTS